MARRRIPDAIEMRRLKYGADVPPAARDAVAKTLRADGRLAEATLLYETRPDHPELAADLATAVREGFSFHVFALRRMGVTVTDDAVRRCAAAAEAKGRWLDAHRCYSVLVAEAAQRAPAVPPPPAGAAEGEAPPPTPLSPDAQALARVKERLPGFRVAVPANKV